MNTASGPCRQWATSLVSGAQMTPDGRTYPHGSGVATMVRPAIDRMRARVRSGLLAGCWVMAAAPCRPGGPARWSHHKRQVLLHTARADGLDLVASAAPL